MSRWWTDAGGGRGRRLKRRNVPMYFMKITDYADELLDELDRLPGWPEPVKTMQRNWIGRSEGARVLFRIDGREEDLEFYSTRAGYDLWRDFLRHRARASFVAGGGRGGSGFAGFYRPLPTVGGDRGGFGDGGEGGVRLPFDAVHPLQPECRVPIYVANYILAGYGTGAIYGCPGHDQRDLDFARQYGLPVIPVISPDGSDAVVIEDRAVLEDGVMINSGPLNGLPCEEAKQRAIELLREAGRGGATQQYRLRDWGISRQRYWGCPIPVVHCGQCGDVPEREENLPVRLPVQVSLDGRGSPLAADEAFVRCSCPECGGEARRETDTMDTFVESSWYFARYASHDYDGAMVDERAAYWMPVNQYIGGIEHACLHLLYARFFHKLMRDAKMYPADGRRYDEPFTRLLCQGMVLKDGGKMSKSKGNTVDPQALIDEYGADTARLFILFAAPPEQSLDWSDDGVKGCARFLNRLWAAASDLPGWEEVTKGDGDDPRIVEAERQLNALLQKACFDMERMRYNNIPSAAMQIVNLLQSLSATPGAAAFLREGMSIVLRLLAPAVPHITQALWRQLGFGEIIADAPWPQPKAVEAEATVGLVVQVNGKKRGIVTVAADADEAAIREAVSADDGIRRHLNGEIKKMVVVPKKLVNLVC